MKTHYILFTGLLWAPLAVAEPPTVESLALKVEALERQVESLKSDLDAAKKEKDIDTDSNKAKNAKFIIDIRKDGKIRVEGLELGEEELAARIRPILKQFPDQPIRIRADVEAKYQDVVRLTDLCQRAGAWHLSFVPGKPKDGQAAPSNGG